MLKFLLPVNDRAARLARSVLAEAIPPPQLDGRSDDPRLALAELVTNAIKHGRLRPDADTVRLVIEADEDAVRVEVEQPTMANEVRVVEPRLDVPERIGGFGLRLVEEVADAWGYEAGPPGRVWCEFRR